MTTATETLSLAVVSRVTGIDADNLKALRTASFAEPGEARDATMAAFEQDRGIDPVTLLALIELVMQLVLTISENCPERNAKQFAKAVARPTLFQRVKTRSLASRVAPGFAVPYTPHEIADSLLTTSAEADESLLMVVHQEAQPDTDNWLL